MSPTDNSGQIDLAWSRLPRAREIVYHQIQLIEELRKHFHDTKVEEELLKKFEASVTSFENALENLLPQP